MLTFFNAMRYQRVTDNLLPVFYLLVLVALLVWRSDVHDFIFPAAAPDLKVRNPQGEVRYGGNFYYWIADSCFVDIRFENSRHSAWSFDLSMDARAGPANRSPDRTVEIVDESGKAQVVTFRDSQVLHFPIVVRHGSNRFTLRVLRPTDWQVRFPGDPMEYMLELRSLELKPLPQ